MNRKVWIVLSFIVIVALTFWGKSRYPDLNAKSVASGAFTASNFINFQQKFHTSSEDGLIQRVILNWFNWINTNKKGMSFGLLLASLILALLDFLRLKNPKSKLGKILMGTSVGAPLGLCVNCAAPVGYSLSKAGRSLETSIAAILSSPTLNIIVLSMSFTLFPFYLASVRLILVLILIFGLLPLLTRNHIKPEDEQNDIALEEVNPHQSFFVDLLEVLKVIGKKIFFVCKKTVPLMVLAGLLGSFFMEVTPLTSFLSGDYSLSKAALVSLISLVLPAPMALDVFLANTFILNGTVGSIALPFMFSLGSYSIYAFFIVVKIADYKFALKIFASIFILSVLGSYATYQTEKILGSRLLSYNVGDSIQRLIDGEIGEKVITLSKGSKRYTKLKETEKYTISYYEHKQRVTGERKFIRHVGKDLGINIQNHFKMKDFLPPFYMGEGMAAGDINNDSQIDAVTSAGSAIYIFENMEELKFNTHILALGGDTRILNVALADLDNDNDLDLLFSSFNDGVYYILNDNNSFHAENKVKIVNHEDAFYTHVISFDDIDGDGDLDIYLGNYSLGYQSPNPGKTSIDALVINDFPNFHLSKQLQMLVPGEVHSALFFDLNGDKINDLWIANDFTTPDSIVFGQGNGRFQYDNKLRQKIKEVTRDSMSLSVGDINNDGIDEIYEVQISQSMSPVFPEVQSMDHYCEGLENEEKKLCQKNIDASKFLNIKKVFEFDKCNSFDQTIQNECLKMAKLFYALKIHMYKGSCDVFKQSDDPYYYNYCQMKMRTIDKKHGLLNQFPLTLSDGSRNTLFFQENGNLVDRAKEFNVAYGGWSWNSKFKDLDNDGFVDLYISNGHWTLDNQPTNLYFKNDHGKSFVDATDSFNLKEFGIVMSNLAEDFDGDGDLDILYIPLNSRPYLMENKANNLNSISFEILVDGKFSKSIGSEIIIHYKGGQQKRHILYSGGFRSQDAHKVHFGLGTLDQVDSLVIKKGKHSMTIEGPFVANKNYKIKTSF